MIKIGSYVRLVSAPSTRMGTITEITPDVNGKLRLKFHHDERFKDQLPDVFRPEDDFEVCVRPSDSEVAVLNRFIQRGS